MNFNTVDISVKLNKKIKINSYLIGALFIANLIANTISMLIPIPNIFAIIVILLAIVSIVKTGIKVSCKMLPLFFIVFTQFALSYLLINSDMTIRFFTAFISIAIPSMIISMKPFDIYKVIEVIQLMGVICSPYLIKIILTQYTIYDAGMLMGIGYAILPVIVSAILVVFGEHVNKWKLLALINLTLSAFVSLKLISRGFFISLLFFIIFLMFYKIKIKPIIILNLSILIFVLLAIYILFFQQQVISSKWYYYLFEIKSQDFLNGRLYDFNNIIEKRSFYNILFGSGIGSYYKNFGFMYIHNIIGMVYYEQGIIVMVILLCILVYSVFKFFTSSNNEYRIITLILLSTSIIRLMVSYYFWIDQIFWIFISIMINYKSIRKYKHL